MISPANEVLECNFGGFVALGIFWCQMFLSFGGMALSACVFCPPCGYNSIYRRPFCVMSMCMFSRVLSCGLRMLLWCLGTWEFGVLMFWGWVRSRTGSSLLCCCFLRIYWYVGPGCVWGGGVCYLPVSEMGGSVKIVAARGAGVHVSI